MKTLQYKKAAPNRLRILTSETLDELGIELKSDLVWDQNNHHRVEVSDRNAEILLSRMGNEFEVVDDDEELETEDETEDTPIDSDETDEDDEDEADSEEDSEDD